MKNTAADALTVDARARMFLDLSRDYLELVPVLESPRISLTARPGADTVETRTVRRALVLSMTLGRKFITRRDPVYMPGLLERIVQERQDRIPRAIRKDVRSTVHDMRAEMDALHDSGGNVIRADGSHVTPGEVWELTRYGHVLHADPAKWSAHGDMGWWVTAAHAPAVLRRLRVMIGNARWCVGDLAARGVLDGVETVELEDIAQDRWTADGSHAGPVFLARE